jgi:hypothetical protein
MSALTRTEAAEHAHERAAEAWRDADPEYLRWRLDLPADAWPSDLAAALESVPECVAVLDGFARPLLCGCAACGRYDRNVVAAAAGFRAQLVDADLRATPTSTPDE